MTDFKLVLDLGGCCYPARLTANSIWFWHPEGKRIKKYQPVYQPAAISYRLTNRVGSAEGTNQLLLRTSGVRQGLPERLRVSDLGPKTSASIKRAVRIASRKLAAKLAAMSARGGTSHE